MTGFDDKFQTINKPVHKPGLLQPPKNSVLWQLFGLWAWSPIVSFQVGLTAGYVALLYFGISGLIAVPPSIDSTTPEWYNGWWAMAVIIGSVVATIGSVSRKKVPELLETLGSGLLTLAVGSYALIVLWVAYAAGDEDRVAGGAGFTALAVPILVRFMWLMSQLLRK